MILITNSVKLKKNLNNKNIDSFLLTTKLFFCFLNLASVVLISYNIPIIYYVTFKVSISDISYFYKITNYRYRLVG